MNPFSVDWNNRKEVLVYAKNLNCNSPQIVYRNPSRSNYNIRHLSNKDNPCLESILDEWIVAIV